MDQARYFSKLSVFTPKLENDMIIALPSPTNSLHSTSVYLNCNLSIAWSLQPVNNAKYSISVWLYLNRLYVLDLTALAMIDKTPWEEPNQACYEAKTFLWQHLVHATYNHNISFKWRVHLQFRRKINPPFIFNFQFFDKCLAFQIKLCQYHVSGSTKL